MDSNLKSYILLFCTQQLLINNNNIYRDYKDSNLKSYII